MSLFNKYCTAAVGISYSNCASVPCYVLMRSSNMMMICGLVHGQLRAGTIRSWSPRNFDWNIIQPPLAGGWPIMVTRYSRQIVCQTHVGQLIETFIIALKYFISDVFKELEQKEQVGCPDDGIIRNNVWVWFLKKCWAVQLTWSHPSPASQHRVEHFSPNMLISSQCLQPK